ncbi:hypothetical protein HDU87_001182 [Geranomyces variabilis]|uniref:D-xylose 1-dehydrogenase (NADP(+), D-xylono-1,5-lactone-forming) n=1 Tax=Geranomyces variabilis TaxID=109894 RepID=A0AAD5TC45_9FUNG|nr:hypothetical protein HDU87_001182 [Geranomyces variabilis]
MPPNIFSRILWPDAPPAPVPKAADAVRVGLLGASRISPRAVIGPAKALASVIVHGVAARDGKKAEAFAKKHGIPKWYTGYEAMLNDPEIDAVYIALPNGHHAEWTLKAIHAGKHVLLEKPSASNATESAAILAATQTQDAKNARIVVLENFHNLFHPALHRARDLVRAGAVGNVHSASVRLCFPNIFGKDDIRFDYALGGGINMDLGTYACSALRFMLDAEPLRVTSATPTTLVRPDVDGEMAATLDFPDGVAASYVVSMVRPWISFVCSGLEGMKPMLEIKGDKGTLSLSVFVLPQLLHKLTVVPTTTTTITADDATQHVAETVYGEGGNTTYWYSLRAFAARIRGAEEPEPQYWIPLEWSVKNQRCVDMVYEKAGLRVRGEA